MAFNVTDLVDYINHNDEISTKVVGGARTIELLSGAGSIVFGKGKEALTSMHNDVIFGDGSTCGRVEGGVTVFEQRYIDYTPLTEYSSFCMKDLYNKYLNKKISVGQKEEKLDNEIYGEILADKTARIASELDKLIWQGDMSVTGSTNMNKVDGFIKVITTDGETETVTGANVLAKLQNFITKIPIALKEAEDFRLFIGKDVEEAIELHLFSLNLFRPSEAKTIAGTLVKYEVIDGLNGTNKVVGARLSNLALEVDDASDASTVESYYEPLHKKVYADFAFGIGVQVRIAEEAYIASI